MQTPRLLVLDDEEAIADLVASIFKEMGYEVDALSSPFDALEAAASKTYSVMIVDVMMPGMDGFEFCHRVSRLTDAPVIFLTAKDQEADVVTGLTLGADDYVTKPFKPRELMARVKAHIRRYEMLKDGPQGPVEGIYESRDLLLNELEHKAYLHDIELQLTPKEFAILSELMKRKGHPVPSERLYEYAWEEPANASSSNTIMVHIRRLRKKLADIDSSQTFIETVWGVGYKVIL